MLKTVIVDDDFRDRDILKQLLERYCPDEVEVAGSASNVAEAFLLIAEKKPGLVFLDIELGSESGFDLLKKFTQYPFRVIFATAHDQYAIQAIKFNALDYLLKPIERERLERALREDRRAGEDQPHRGRGPRGERRAAGGGDGGIRRPAGRAWPSCS